MPAQQLISVSDRELLQRDIKAAFFDIDGTLLSLDGQYSQASVDEIRRVKNIGVKTAVASGRPHFAADFIIRELSLDDPGVFCTGAHVYSPKSDQTLSVSNLPKDVCYSLISELRAMNVHYELYTEDNYYMEKNCRPEIANVHAQHMRKVPENFPFDDLVENSAVVKLLVAVDKKEDHTLLYELETRFPDLHFAYAGIAAYPDWIFASVIYKQACKEKAFDVLLAYHNIEASQVISFGDAHSDMVFLQRAGVGVAMGNASDEVKSIADFVTKPVWEDGVAYALSRFIR